MTQFLPTFPAFITRRFSRTSNDDDVADSSSPISYPNTSAVAQSDGSALSISPPLEEEGTTLSFSNRAHTPSHEIIPPEQLPATEENSSERELQVWNHARQVDLNLLASQVAREDVQALRTTSTHIEGDASSSSLQEVAHGLRSAASSVSSSVRSAQDAPLDSTLPADDGMATMRARIVVLQNSSASNQEKARQMLAFMTEQYNASQANLQSQRPLKTLHRSRFTSPELRSSTNSDHSIEAVNLTSSPPTSPSSHSGDADLIQVTSEDRQPTYYKRTRRPSDGHGSSGRALDYGTGSGDSDEDLMAYGCPHYKRNIKLQCSTCSRWYTCRFCHDAIEDHKLVRRETKHMMCMFCNCPQKASGVCVECGQSAAWYYCDVCKLWDDNPNRSIYHCDDCGICRVGKGIGKDFYHCKTCGVCLEIGIAESHRCIERSTDCDCPICGEYMFTSPEKVVFMKCGHSIHQKCYEEHIQRSYRCPICSRSVLNMEAHFEHLKRLIEIQPMPSHLQDTKAWVYCNDCSAKTTVKYHWLGCACDVCDSFNTAMLRILKIPDSDSATSVDTADFRDEQASPHTSTHLVRQVPRGRSSLLTGQSLRTGTSVSAVEAAITAQIPPANRIQRTIRSASPVLRSQQPTMDSSGTLGSDGDGSDEVSFWGGSPRPGERLRSPSNQPDTGTVPAQDGSDASSSGYDEMSDDEDGNPSDELGSDDSDEMELVGHI